MNQGYLDPPYSPEPRIGEWLSESFALFSREWQVWVVQGLLCTLLIPLPMLVGYFLFFAITVVAAAAGGGRDGDVALLVPGVLVFFACSLGTPYLGIRLSVGMERTAARQLRGEPIQVRDLFDGGDVFWSALCTRILVGAVHLVGFLLCGIGVYVAGGLTMLAFPAIADERIGAAEAVERSWNATRSHWVLYAVWYFLIGVIGSLGVYACGIGVAATLPISIIALMVTYRDAVGLPGALPPMSAAQQQVFAGGYPGGYPGAYPGAPPPPPYTVAPPPPYAAPYTPPGPPPADPPARGPEPPVS